MNRTVIFSLTIGLILFAVIEGASYLIGTYVFPTSVIFKPSFSEVEKTKLRNQYAEYLGFRNPLTGLPFRENNPSIRDPSGSRLNPLYPYEENMQNCVSLFGDSFTWSDEVTKEFAWSAVLSEFLGCRVGNFGVGGFGTDQAYLRYLNKTADQAPIVFLNHQSENVLRNVTQFRALTGGYTSATVPLNFKPRYVVDDDGSLQLIDMPTFDSEEYPDVLYDPGSYLTHEYFLPGGQTGLVRLSFPYSWSLIRSLGHFHIKAWLTGKPWYMELYEPQHPSNGLSITTGILLKFRDSAIKRGQIPVITIIPNGLDLTHYNDHGTWPYQNLLDELATNGVDVLNFGTGIMERLDDTDPCSLFDNCSAHFNEQGYRYLAEIAAEELTKRGLAPDAAAPPDTTAGAN